MFKDQILVFSLVGRQTILVVYVCRLLISCHISTRLPPEAGQKTEWFIQSEFFEVESVSFMFIEFQLQFSEGRGLFR